MGTRIGSNTSNVEGSEGDFQNITQTTTGTKSALDVAVITTGSGEAIEDIEIFEDTSFVTGDSPVSLDFNTVLSKNATVFEVINDGAGDFTFAVSEDGAAFGGEATLKKGEGFTDAATNVDTLRLTWIANSAYRVRYR